MEQYVREFIVYLTEEEQASENTVQSYRRDLLKLCGYFERCGIHTLSEVTHTNLTSYILEMESSELAPSSISRAISSIRSFFSYLTENRVIEKNVARKLSSPKVVHKKPETLTPEEVKLFLNQSFPDTNKGKRDKALIELLFATGMRVSELISLCLSDVQFDLGVVQCGISEPKRVVPVEPIALDAVKAYVKDARDAMNKKNKTVLFLNYAGDMLTRQGVWKLLRSYGASAGIARDITPHLIRHTFASELVNHGADLKAVQEMMGHADLSTTQTYVDRGNHQVLEEYKKSHAWLREAGPY